MVEEKKKVSIIIPVYNVEKYVSRCLDSITGQTYGNIEILINNDGSTDSSYEICKEYAPKDTRIKLFSQPNAGLSEARNAMFKHVTGDYVMFVDSDDYIALNAVESLIKLIEENDVDCVSFSFKQIPEAKIYEPISLSFKIKRKTCSPIKHVRKMLRPPELHSLGCFAWENFFKVEYLKCLEFPKRMIFEDLISMPVMILKMKKILETNEIFYYYINRAGSIIHSSNLYERCLCEVNAYIHLYNRLNDQERKKIIRSLSLAFLYKYYCRKRDLKLSGMNTEEFQKTFSEMKKQFWKGLLLGTTINT